MGTTPPERLERLRRHVVDGWRRVSRDASERSVAARWLAAHPSGYPDVDALWSAALRGAGELARWLDDGAEPGSWSAAVPLHSVLSSHPFASLTPWQTPWRSSAS